jgi:hypothetical protein
LILNYFGDSVSGPEKAGVGGSSPSLATISFKEKGKSKKAREGLPLSSLLPFYFCLEVYRGQ